MGVVMSQKLLLVYAWPASHNARNKSIKNFLLYNQGVPSLESYCRATRIVCILYLYTSTCSQKRIELADVHPHETKLHYYVRSSKSTIISQAINSGLLKKPSNIK